MSRIENLGFFNRCWIVLTGKNRQYCEFNDALNGNTVKGDFIATVGKRAVIVTQVENGKRVPIIVKRLRKTGECTGAGIEFSFVFKNADTLVIEEFIDSDNNKWSFYSDLLNSEYNELVCDDNDDNLIYEFKSKMD